MGIHSFIFQVLAEDPRVAQALAGAESDSY